MASYTPPAYAGGSLSGHRRIRGTDNQVVCEWRRFSSFQADAWQIEYRLDVNHGRVADRPATGSTFGNGNALRSTSAVAVRCEPRDVPARYGHELVEEGGLPLHLLAGRPRQPERPYSLFLQPRRRHRRGSERRTTSLRRGGGSADEEKRRAQPTESAKRSPMSTSAGWSPRTHSRPLRDWSRRRRN